MLRVNGNSAVLTGVGLPSSLSSVIPSTSVRSVAGMVRGREGSLTFEAAYSVLDDPALELRFATPVRAEQTLLARLGLILVIQAACALVTATSRSWPRGRFSSVALLPS